MRTGCTACGPERGEGAGSPPGESDDSHQGEVPEQESEQQAGPTSPPTAQPPLNSDVPLPHIQLFAQHRFHSRCAKPGLGGFPGLQIQERLPTLLPPPFPAGLGNAAQSPPLLPACLPAACQGVALRARPKRSAPWSRRSSGSTMENNTSRHLHQPESGVRLLCLALDSSDPRQLLLGSLTTRSDNTNTATLVPPNGLPPPERSGSSPIASSSLPLGSA
ncbi:hypothetical protein CB1_001219006 [Camelus ferus]|nr:hypothetical protein CB1_001219006 [Camelus ferus]